MSIPKRLRRIWRYLGAGLITGAADDDPAGITTYAIAGARLGFSSLWTPFFTFPLMAAVQEMAARIGIITKMGLAGVLKKHYPFWILTIAAFLMVSGNILNIGADISGMSATTNILIPQISSRVLAFIYSVLIIVLMLFLRFKKLIRYFKWLSLTLLFYVLTALLTSYDWSEVFNKIIAPELIFNKETISIIVAVFGTTISPYLFFWQTTEEAAEEKAHHHNHNKIKDKKLERELNHTAKDVTFGMFFSNFIMFFVMLLAATLFFGGNFEIETIDQLSKLLNPLLGRSGQIIFTLGIVGTGLLVIPILAAGSAYILAETFEWSGGLEKKFHRAKEFYAVIIVSTALALILNYFGFNPIKLLFYTALFHGLISSPLILAILFISNNKKIMGSYTNSGLSNILGFTAFLIMALGTILYFVL